MLSPQLCLSLTLHGTQPISITSYHAGYAIHVCHVALHVVHSVHETFIGTHLGEGMRRKPYSTLHFISPEGVETVTSTVHAHSSHLSGVGLKHCHNMGNMQWIMHHTRIPWNWDSMLQWELAPHEDDVFLRNLRVMYSGGIRVHQSLESGPAFLCRNSRELSQVYSARTP